MIIFNKNLKKKEEITNKEQNKEKNIKEPKLEGTEELKIIKTDTNSSKESKQQKVSEKKKENKSNNEQKNKPKPKEMTFEQMKTELNRIEKFGSKARSNAVQNNILRATTMSLELLRNCNSLKIQYQSYIEKETIFNNLQKEYLDFAKVQEDLLNHYESLVSNLLEENRVLKDTFKANDIAIPIVEEAFPKPKPKKILKPKQKKINKEQNTKNGKEQSKKQTEKKNKKY